MMMIAQFYLFILETPQEISKTLKMSLEIGRLTVWLIFSAR